MAQFYQDKNQEQQFYSNVEEQTVQYLITPDKTQVQYPTQQIVVASGEQLMVVDSQQSQTVADHSGTPYQGQQIHQQSQVQVSQVVQQQVQVQSPQYAVIQDGSINLNNGTQQIFLMDAINVESTQGSPQPIVLNHQIGQTSIRVRPPIQLPPQIRAVVRQPALLQQQRSQVRSPMRSPNPNQQSPRPIISGITNQIRITTPNQSQIRQPSPNPSPVKQQNPNQSQPLRQPITNQIRTSLLQQQQQQQQLRQQTPRSATQQQFRSQTPGQISIRPTNQGVRQLIPGQQIRIASSLGQRPPAQVARAPTAFPRFPSLSLLQHKAVNQGMDLNEEIKMTEEQEVAASLSDGSIVSLTNFKKLVNEAKQFKTTIAAASANTQTAVQSQNHQPVQANQVDQPTRVATPKRRNPPKNPRQPPKTGTVVRSQAKGRANTAISQFGPALQQHQQQQQIQQLQQQQQQQVQANNNDPSRYAMMNQHSQINKPSTPTFPGNQTPQAGQTPTLVSQHQQMMQQQKIQQAQPRPSQANYVIQPPKMNPKPQQQRPLPPYIPSSQIQKIIESTPVGEEFSDSIRMLVLLENGEQRLITFTLPKEACTIQEILEQVNVPFQSNTNIQVTEANSNGINYIVTVGNVPSLGYDEDETMMPEEPISAPPPTFQQQQQLSTVPTQIPIPSPPPPPLSLQQLATCQNDIATLTPLSVTSETSKSATTPEPPPKDIPKFMTGMLALCGACGYLSENFAKCIRCLRPLPENVKAIPATIRTVGTQKKEAGTLPVNNSNSNSSINANPPKSNPVTPTKKKRSKPVEVESVHVISSDEEDEEAPSKVSLNILQKLGASVTISPISKEPSPNDIQRLSGNLKSKVATEQQNGKHVTTTVICRTVRIGSYRCIPFEKKVLVDSKQILMKVPHTINEKQIKTIKIDKSDIIKVLASFNPALPVIFYYINPAVAKTVRDDLGMTVDGDYYYDPLSVEEEAFRRITLLPDDVNDDDKNLFQLIYGGPPNIMEELNVKEANDILIKTCPKELTQATLGMSSFTEIKQLLTYPPEGRGRISINTEDYVCLAQDQFLNDVIIDFYLKYLVEHLPENQKEKVHVFSTFFYKRLTTKPVKASRKSQPAELDPTLNASQKRHARVKTWTKNVNLFEKDFIIVPINENAHWFLAIICFPGIIGCQTWDGNVYTPEIKPKRTKKTKSGTSTNSTVAVKQEKDKPIICEEPELSDKDEAEGDDSEMESDDSEELPSSQNALNLTTTPTPSVGTAAAAATSPVAVPTTVVTSTVTPTPPPQPTPRGKKEQRPAIKQPCILIFDSLAGANRSRVVATLRDYLTCEHMAKLGKEKIYNRDVIKGANPKVPQQNNFTDCGLYVLQYVEQFFKEPIKDYHIPIKEIQNWFDEIVVTKKREDIANLIKTLMKEYGIDTRMLPDIVFPTLNGKLLEREFDEEEEEEEEEELEDEMMGEEETPSADESDIKDNSFVTVKSIGSSGDNISDDELNADEVPSPIKPSPSAISGDFVTQTVVNLKPDLREFPRQTNKDTLSILKAKRISRHKNPDGPEVKKLKSDQVQ